MMSLRLAPTIRPGLVNLAGATPKSKVLIERLLEEDRVKHHCFFNNLGFHNHLSHHLLAAYDLGAPAPLLQAIYSNEAKAQRPIDLKGPNDFPSKPEPLEITTRNWNLFLGQHEYYSSYLTFFSAEIATDGPSKALEGYVFSPAANENGAAMLQRFVGGAFHPMIQVGYGVEFGSDAMIAQGLAQAAVSQPVAPDLLNDYPNYLPTETLSLLGILRRAYDSPDLHPVMPYDPDALLSARRRDALKGGRKDAIAQLSACWFGSSFAPKTEEAFEKDLQEKVEEVFWVSTLLLAGTSKPDRPPRLDFFIMHILNSTLFLPSLFSVISSIKHKAQLLRTLLPVYLLYLLMRGRPRISAELIMTYTDIPSPPGTAPRASSDAIEPDAVNPWPAIIASVIHAPDSHTIKAIRALYYAAQQYGTTPPGSVPGAFFAVKGDGQAEETHQGIAGLDGTVFVRAAGVVMNTLGWITHGQAAGNWDTSALGWDEAWKE